MSKLLIGVFAAAAFAYAAYIVLLRRPLPELARSEGFKRRFLLTSTAFVGAIFACMSSSDAAEMRCYESPANSSEEKPRIGDFIALANSIWQGLDEGKAANFNRTVDEFASSGAFDSKVASYLKLAYSEMARHRMRTESGATCYKMSTAGVKAQASRERLEAQLKVIDKAKAEGGLNSDAAEAAAKAIAKELEELSLLKTPPGKAPETQQPESDASSAQKAAGLIVELQK